MYVFTQFRHMEQFFEGNWAKIVNLFEVKKIYWDDKATI